MRLAGPDLFPADDVDVCVEVVLTGYDHQHVAWDSARNGFLPDGVGCNS